MRDILLTFFSAMMCFFYFYKTVIWCWAVLFQWSFYSNYLFPLVSVWKNWFNWKKNRSAYVAWRLASQIKSRVGWDRVKWGREGQGTVRYWRVRWTGGGWEKHRTAWTTNTKNTKILYSTDLFGKMFFKSSQFDFLWKKTTINQY